LAIIILLISACSDDCIAPTPHDYGDPYAEIDCAWVDPDVEIRTAVWRCFEDLQTEILSGFVFLELENLESLYLCGTDLILNTGVTVYDNLIGLLTEGRYNCLHLVEDKNLGNSFDWTWNDTTNVLQFIWRPDEDPEKILTLVIADAEYDVIVRTTIYYKILGEE
jgi:hypothetical protein